MSSSDDRQQKRQAQFRELAADRIERLNLLWLDAEQGEQQAEHGIKRELHTLKGDASLTGFRAIATLTHALEDATLAMLADPPLQSEDGDLYFECLDILTELALQAPDSEHPGGPEILERLQARAGAAPSGDGPTDAAPKLEPPPTPAPPTSEPTTTTSSVGSAHRADRSIRVDDNHLDTLRELVGELLLSRSKLRSTTARVRRERESGARDRGSVSDAELAHRLESSLANLESGIRDDVAHLSNLVSAMEELTNSMRMVPIATLFNGYPRYVRELSRDLGKKVRLDVRGEEVRLDQSVINSLEEPLLHLLRNALDHGIESPAHRVAAGKEPTGRLTIKTRLRGNAIELTLQDDGQGIDVEQVRAKALERGLLDSEHATDSEVLQTLLASGMTTREEVSSVSGRGIGLDVVDWTLRQLGGTMNIRSTPGAGTTFTLLAPLSTAISNVLTFQVGAGTYALPAEDVVSIVSDSRVVESIHGDALRYEDETIPVYSLASALGEDLPEGAGKKRIMIVRVADRGMALADTTEHEHAEAVLRPAGELLKSHHLVSAGCPFGDGRVALLINTMRLGSGQRATLPAGPTIKRYSILVVDDSPIVRDMLREAVISFDMNVIEAQDGADALEKLDDNPHIDMVLTDLDMPRIDGIELVKTLRRRTGPRLPAVVISTRGSDSDKLAAINAGADGYIVKSSFTRANLRDVMSKFLAL